MRYNAIFFSTILSISLFFTFSIIDSAQSLPPGVSPQEYEKFQKEMADFQKEFDALSTEEKDSFFKSMDEAVKKIEDLSKTDEGKALLDKLEKGTISDQELDGLINKLVADDNEVKAPDKKVETEKQKEPVRPKQILTSKQEQIIESLNSFIAHTNSFIVKAATVPELPNKFNQWIKKKQIVPKDKNWNTFKADIEQLVLQLSLLLERDIETKEYYHIPELVKNEALKNNIEKVEKNISKLEPLIEEMPLLEVKKMTKESKRAFQRIINEYYEAVSVLKLSDEIKNLLKLFDPVAKKYRETHELARKEAEKQSRKGLAAQDFSSIKSTDDIDYDPRNFSASYPMGNQIKSKPYAYGSSYSKSGYQTPKKPAHIKTDNKKHGSKHVAPGKGPLKPESDAKIGNSKELSSRAKNGTKQPATIDKKLQDDLNLIKLKIEDKMRELQSMIEDNDLVAKLKKEFIDASPIDYTLAVEILPDMSKTINLQKGIIGDIHRLHRKAQSEKVRSDQKRQINTIYDKSKKIIKAFRDEIQNIKSEWDSKKTSIPAAKRYAFFGEIDSDLIDPLGIPSEQPQDLEKQKLQEAHMKIPAPYSLFDIYDQLNEMEKALAEFEKTKLSK